jgi:hypothetical protein
MPWFRVLSGSEIDMAGHTGNGYFFVIAGNAIRPSQSLGARLFDRRPDSTGGGSTATWLVVTVAALSSLVLGFV